VQARRVASTALLQAFCLVIPPILLSWTTPDGYRSLSFDGIHLYPLGTTSDEGNDEEDENGRVDAAVRTVKEWLDHVRCQLGSAVAPAAF
jgi:hypothetical protein